MDVVSLKNELPEPLEDGTEVLLFTQFQRRTPWKCKADASLVHRARAFGKAPAAYFMDTLCEYDEIAASAACDPATVNLGFLFARAGSTFLKMRLQGWARQWDARVKRQCRNVRLSIIL